MEPEEKTMNIQKDDNNVDSQVFYPKINDENDEIKEELEDNKKKRKKKNSKNTKIINNPIITHFNKESKFIYDINEVDNYLSKIKNKKNLKLN